MRISERELESFACSWYQGFLFEKDGSSGPGRPQPWELIGAGSGHALHQLQEPQLARRAH